MGADQAGGTGADDDDIAFDELIELFIVFPRDLAVMSRSRSGAGFGFPMLLFLSAAAEHDSRLRSRLHQILNVPLRVRLRCEFACGLAG